MIQQNKMILNFIKYLIITTITDLFTEKTSSISGETVLLKAKWLYGKIYLILGFVMTLNSKQLTVKMMNYIRLENSKNKCLDLSCQLMNHISIHCSLCLMY